jgi:hypothetical protein
VGGGPTPAPAHPRAPGVPQDPAEEAAKLEDADVLVRGRSRATGGEAFRVVEVFAKVDTDDAKRAEILRKARPEAEGIPVAAGPEIHPLAAWAARGPGGLVAHRRPPLRPPRNPARIINVGRLGSRPMIQASPPCEEEATR